MIENTPIAVWLALVVGAFIGLTIAHHLFNERLRQRLWRRTRCLFGRHAPGAFEDRVGGIRVQRCDYCDRVVRRYEVTVNQAKTETIRRTY